MAKKPKISSGRRAAPPVRPVKANSRNSRTGQPALPKFPFTMGDRGSYIRKAAVAVAAMGKEYIAVLHYEFAYNRVSVMAVHRDEIDASHQGTRAMYVDGAHTNFGPTGLAKTHLQWLKIQALRGGATPDAIRYIKETIGLTKQEEQEMAKAATKTKPVGKGGKVAGGKGKGNPEALERARAASQARNAENAKQKLTVTAKLGDVKLRGGRLAKFEWVAKNKPKTVGDALGQEVTDSEGTTHKIDMGALRGMEKRGHIKIG